MKKISCIFVCLTICFASFGCRKSSQSESEYFVDIEKAVVGDYVKFGKFEQDDDLTNGAEDIVWEVIDYSPNSIFLQEGQGSLLLISKDSLDYRSHYDASASNKDVYTWKNSEIRKWLIDEFYYDAFSLEERDMIVPEMFVSDGKVDKVFILSSEEVLYYFQEDERKCNPSIYAQNRNDKIILQYCWWMRDCGNGGDFWYERYKFVDEKGVVFDWGAGGYEKLAVRPAIRVAVKKRIILDV